MQSVKVPSKIILYDDICNFCCYWIDFIRVRDRNNIFKFAALQSEEGRKFSDKHNLSISNFDSVILISQNKIFEKSSAVFEIIKHLNSWVKLFYPVKVLPISINDFFYDLIAKNRFKFFGKKKVCSISAKNEIKKIS